MPWSEDIPGFCRMLVRQCFFVSHLARPFQMRQKNIFDALHAGKFLLIRNMNQRRRAEFFAELQKPVNQIDLMKFSSDIPKLLYRYRDASLNNLDALLNNRLYFSTANYYDDPLDTLLYIDRASLKRDVDTIIGRSLSEPFPQELSQRLDADSSALSQSLLANCKLIKTLIDPIVDELRKQFKTEIYSICFSEDGMNQESWLKYAHNHEGFVIEFASDQIVESYKTAHSVTGGALDGTIGFLYPIVYSRKPFCANELFKDLICKAAKMEWAIGDRNRFLINRRCACLVKSKYHCHDKEWRLFMERYDQAPSYIMAVPKSVTMGLRISPAGRDAILAICKHNSIPVYEAYITDECKLKRRRVCV